MSWLTEVRAAVDGLNLDTVEMSEAVVVKFSETWLRIGSDRSVCVEPMITFGAVKVHEQPAIDTIMNRLDRRVWRVE